MLLTAASTRPPARAAAACCCSPSRSPARGCFKSPATSAKRSSVWASVCGERHGVWSLQLGDWACGMRQRAWRGLRPKP
eukprot:1002506-Alexandrium_andersonii.AAC.1